MHGARLLSVGLAILLLALAPPVLSSYVLALLTQAVISAMLAMSLDLLLSYTGLASLGHAAYLGLRAYSVGVLTTQYGANFWGTLAVGIVLAAGVAMVFGLVALRATGVYFLMITLALGIVVWGLAQRWVSLPQGDNGISGIPKPNLGLPWSFSTSTAFYYLVLAGFLVTYTVLGVVVRSPFGQSLVGIRESESRTCYPVAALCTRRRLRRSGTTRKCGHAISVCETSRGGRPQAMVFCCALRHATLLPGPHNPIRAEEGKTMDRCNDLCTKEATGQCTLCEALAERDRFIRLWMKGGFLREGLRAMQRGFSREVEEHKAVVWRSIAAIWHQGQFEAIEEVMAPTYVHHTSHTAGDSGQEVHGPDGVRGAVTAWRSAFPDLHFTLEDLLVEGDKVVARWTCRGTHYGVFRGMAPTGKRVTFTGMTLYRMAQGKIAEQWTVEDGVSLYQQLGILRS